MTGGLALASHIIPKILIADDSRFQAQLLASYLDAKAFEVIFAADALQAWMAALRSNPAVILLDINMPGGTGMEVLKRLKISSKTHDIPVIVVSGDGDPETESKARGLGAADFLHKPVEQDRLCEAVDRVLTSGIAKPNMADGAKPRG